MKFMINLFVDNPVYGNLLPVNYQFALSSFINNTLKISTELYTHWLSINCLNTHSNCFQPYSYSNLILPKYGIDTNTIAINSANCAFILSFLLEQHTYDLVCNAFNNKQFCIGDRFHKVAFRVAGIEILPDTTLTSSTEFVAITPVCISSINPKLQQLEYHKPNTEFAIQSLHTKLKTKYKNFYSKPYTSTHSFDMCLTNTPRSKLLTINNNTAKCMHVKAYQFCFSMLADPALMHIMYKTGLGEKNSMGFGHIETRENFRYIQQLLRI